jgi:hypothetical protein
MPYLLAQRKTVANEKRTCLDCFRVCRSVACFEHHKKSCKSKGVDLPSRCETSFKCQTCSVTVERKRQDDHRCGEHVCHVCKEYVLSDPLCYMQREPPKNPNDKLIFYDFETDCSSGEHLVNFLQLDIIVTGRSLYLKGTMHCMNFASFYFLWSIKVSRLSHTMQKDMMQF